MTDTTTAPDTSAPLTGTAVHGGPSLPFTQDQAREMADALVHHGGATREQADAALRADGFEPAAPDTRTDEQREFDAMFPPAKPEDFKVNYTGRVPTGVEPETVAEFHREATEWLHKLDFPDRIGSSVMETIIDAAQKQARMSPAERANWAEEQAAIMQRIAGDPEKVDARRKLAEAALARAPGPFVNTLRHLGVLNSADVLLQLALQGERLSIRGKR